MARFLGLIVVVTSWPILCAAILIVATWAESEGQHVAGWVIVGGLVEEAMRDMAAPNVGEQGK